MFRVSDCDNAKILYWLETSDNLTIETEKYFSHKINNKTETGKLELLGLKFFLPFLKE